MKRSLLRIIITILSLASSWSATSQYAAHSQLSSGRWVKIKVEQSGVYRLTASALADMGFTDPSKVSVHGYGGWILDEDFSKGTYLDDVPAIPIWRDGESIYFYAKGPVKWEYNAYDRRFSHTNNPYSTAGYYFVTDATDVLNMETQASVEGAVRQISTFDDYQVWETESVAVNESGRQLFGESFTTTTSRDFTFTVPGITQDDAIITMRFIAKTSSRTPVTLEVGDERLNLSISAPVQYETYTAAVADSGSIVWRGEKNERVNMNVTYGKSGDENAHLDYIRFQMRRALRLYDSQTAFRSTDAIGNVSRFQVGDASSSTIVFEITDTQAPKLVSTTLDGSTLSFSISASSQLREFVAFDKDRLNNTPIIAGEINPQDLHGMELPNMVIIVPNAFTSQAERLAEEHRKRNGLKVAVINPEAIYNEFSSGMPEATAYRRMLKMFYDRSTDTDALQYLLLFGDGAFDNRGLTHEWSQNSSLLSNMLLTYQSENSINIYSYTSDDYFGVLEDNSGRNLASYMDNTLPGDWKNNITFMADDGSNADTDKQIHMRQANELAQIVQENYPEFRINKLYFDAYTKERTGGNASYPDVESNLQKQLKNGLMVLNYVGHGNTTSLIM